MRCVATNGAQHRVEAVPSGRAQVLLQADLVDETVSGGQDLPRRKARIGSQQQRNQARNDGCVASRLEVQLAVSLRGMEPDLRLAAPDLECIDLVLRRERR